MPSISLNASHLWLIPAVPLLVSLTILSLNRSQRSVAALLAISGQVLAFLLALAAFFPTLHPPGYRSFANFTWFTFGEQSLRLGWVLDPLTSAMLLMITSVSIWIFVFSVGYMREDQNFNRFFAYLSFFTAAMLGVVIANSLLLLFVCWELVGLASYLLIGFWIERPSAAAAAKKAFITTRIGDLGLFLGLLALYQRSGTLLFYDHGHGALETTATLGASATLIALLIFCGAVGKSGQFPLHVWLPDAMEGPTPVSALIHAATMVAAGVFLVARVYPIFAVGAINGVTTSLTVVVWIGVITGLMAALIALAQSDIKRILAYSTVSQLGLMMVSLGVGGVAAGIMHLLAHGFFKALLFLGAGSVIHGLHHEQDIRKMGGLRRSMPITFLTYAIGMMSLSGVPLFFAGAWTKEAVLHASSRWPVSSIPYYLLLAGVILTTLYMTRQIIYVFFEKPRGVIAHESPRGMTGSLVVLAIATIGLSAILTPAWPWLHSYLAAEPTPFEPAHLVEPMIVISLLCVGAGLALGWLIYRRTPVEDPLAKAQPALFGFLANKMWLDELYHYTVIAFARAASVASDLVDRYFWDGIVRSFGAGARLLGLGSTSLDEKGINAGVDDGAIGARGLGRLLSRGHSGNIQTYLGAVAFGMIALLLLYAWLG